MQVLIVRPKWAEILSDMAETRDLSVWYQYAQLMYVILKSCHLVRSLFCKKLRFFQQIPRFKLMLQYNQGAGGQGGYPPEHLSVGGQG